MKQAISYLLVLSTVLTLASCTRSTNKNASMVDDDLVVHAYVSVGEIVTLPEAPTKGSAEEAKSARFMKIRHEPIPDFKNRKGKVVGMGAMAMSFEIPEGVSVAEFSVGDKVDFAFESVWRATPKHRLTKIEKFRPNRSEE
jgi:Cu/Ag efflux protein CusF